VESLMKQIEIYVGNLQHLSQQAGQYGGEELAPLHVVNQIKLQRKSIVERLNELADLMNQIYDVQVEGVGKLAEALDAA
jgi:phage-related minor tail protein